MLKALPRSRAARAPVGVNTQIVCSHTDRKRIDWHPNGDCYCQDDCACMLDVGGDATTITRDSAVGALPEQCIDDDDTSYGGYDDTYFGGYDDTYFGGYDDITYGGGRKLKSRKAQK